MDDVVAVMERAMARFAGLPVTPDLLRRAERDLSLATGGSVCCAQHDEGCIECRVRIRSETFIVRLEAGAEVCA